MVYYITDSRSRICELTNAAALLHEYGNVASRMRLRKPVIHASFFNKSSKSHARHASPP